jgi:hypothetical protein
MRPLRAAPPPGADTSKNKRKEKKEKRDKTKDTLHLILILRKKRVAATLVASSACRAISTQVGTPTAGRFPTFFSRFPFPFFLSAFFHPSSVSTESTRVPRFRCRRGWLNRFGHDARPRPGMLGVHEGVHRGGIPNLLGGLAQGLRSRALPLGWCARGRCWRCRRGRRGRRCHQSTGELAQLLAYRLQLIIHCAERRFPPSENLSYLSSP